MKLSMLALAAALTLGGLAATAADAQRDRGDRGDRTVVRTTRTVVMHRRTSAHQDWNRGRHRGWGNHQRTCRTTWRHGQRIRTCRSW
jgi:Ni/Co efflux regulator RcnB